MKPKTDGESKTVSVSGESIPEKVYSGRYSYEQSCPDCLSDLSVVPKWRNQDGLDFRLCPGCGQNIPVLQFKESKSLLDEAEKEFGPREDASNCKRIEESLVKKWLVEKHSVKPNEFTEDQIVNLIVKLTKAYGEIEITSSNQNPLAVYTSTPHPTPPTNPEFWRKLGGDFKSLDGGDKMRATWSFEIDSGKETWQLGLGPQQSQSMFKRLARQAAVTLGYPGGEDGVDAWLNLLRSADSYIQARGCANGHASVYLGRLCTASADYCVELQTLAMENESSQKACNVQLSRLDTEIVTVDNASSRLLVLKQESKVPVVENFDSRAGKDLPSEQPTLGLIKARNDALKRYRLQEGLDRHGLARRAKASLTAIEGMVREDRKRYSITRRNLVLENLKIPLETWYDIKALEQLNRDSAHLQ